MFSSNLALSTMTLYQSCLQLFNLHLFISICTKSAALKFSCLAESCLIEDVDLNDDYTFAFSYPNTNTKQLMVFNVRGELFDLTALPNLANIRDFTLENSLLHSLKLKLTAENSTVHITQTPLETIVFHESRNIMDIRIVKTNLETIPSTIYTQELLEILFITHSFLVSIDFDLFHKLANLLHVNFSFNRLHNLHFSPNKLCCHRLVSLDFQNNRLKQFNFGVLAHMHCLGIVVLRANHLRTIEIRDLAATSAMELKRVCNDLNGGPEESSDMQEEQETAPDRHFSHLATIDLNSNQLGVVNLSLFTSMPSLMDLIISKNMLTDVIVVDGKLPKRLQHIDLSSNRLAKADLRPLLSISSVYVGGNQ